MMTMIDWINRIEDINGRGRPNTWKEAVDKDLSEWVSKV